EADRQYVDPVGHDPVRVRRGESLGHGWEWTLGSDDQPGEERAADEHEGGGAECGGQTVPEREMLRTDRTRSSAAFPEAHGRAQPRVEHRSRDSAQDGETGKNGGREEVARGLTV